MRKLRIPLLLITMILAFSVMAFAAGLEDALPLEATPASGAVSPLNEADGLMATSDPTVYLDNNYYDLTIRQGNNLPLRFSCIGGGNNYGYMTITDTDGNIVGDLVRYVNLSTLDEGTLYYVSWDAETASLPAGQYWVMSFVADKNGNLPDPDDYCAVLLTVVGKSNPLKSVSFFDAEKYTYDQEDLTTLSEVTLCPGKDHFYGVLYNPTNTTTERPVDFYTSDEAVAQVYYYSGDAYVVAEAPGTATITVSAGNNVSGTLKVTVAHDYVQEVTEEPTCSSEGTVTYTCPCGHSYTESIPADKNYGHQVANPTITTAPTACKPGQATGYCSLCHKTVTYTVPAIFTDVSATRFYSNAVDYFHANGIVSGMTPTTFGVEEPLTRGMLLTLLYRMEGQPTCTAGTPFTDVEANRYFTTPIAWAYKNKIANGITATTFEPGTAITREQLATFIYRYAKYKNIDVTGGASLSNYPDGDDIHNFAKDAMAWAVDAGIITGIAEGGAVYLSPTGEATRAQAVTMLYRYIDFAEKNPATQEPENPEDTIMVWIPKSGARYHYDSDCPGTGNMEQVSLSYAKAVGYIPCSVCVK